jgi:RNA polymerase sigma factor for flagellar operon FliA
METNARELLTANISLIRQLVHATSRRHRLAECEKQDFESWMWVRLVDNDFHVIRRFQGRASFATYLRVVLQRAVLDYRAAKWGKWRPSARARRLGPKAVALERLITRDGVSPEVAAAQLNVSESELPPRRQSRRQFIEPLDVTADVVAPQGTSPDEGVLTAERKNAAREVTEALARILNGMPSSDRRLLWLRYAARLTVAQIARKLEEDPGGLYRRFVRLHATLRSHLEASGIRSADVSGLIGAADVSVQGVFTASERDALATSGNAWPLAS